MVKITALTDLPTPVAADVLAIIDDVAVSPITKKATLNNVLAVYDTQTATMTNKTLIYDINAQTGTTYTFVLTDAGDIVTSNNAATVVMTIPPNSSVAYPVGASLTIISIGAGLTNFAVGAGVTINSTGAVPAAPVLRIQHSSATAIKIATDTWQVVGDIS
jgi:hypothetical protein